MDNLFFYFAKLTWIILQPDNLIVFAIVVICILFIIRLDRTAKKLFYILSGAILFVALFPVGGWLIYPLETRFHPEAELPEKIDGIILLGGSFLPTKSNYWGKTQTNLYADRIFHFVSLMNRYPNAKAVFTGGDASLIRSHSTEAQIAQKLFMDMGIQNDRIIYEDRARNTFENGKYSYQLVKPEKGENWIAVSSAPHLPRVVGVFCKLGWPVIPFAADYHTYPDGLLTPSLDLGNHLVQLNNAIYEWAGLTAYYFSGRTSQWFPDGCH